jgi:serralysin
MFISTRHFRGTAFAASAGLILAGAAASLTPAGPAAAATPAATVSSTPTSGLVYTGTASSTITWITLSGATFTIHDISPITLSGATFTIHDISPITAGIGCSAVPGDVTQVRCVAQKDSAGAVKRFRVSTLGAADTVFNQTSVGMLADGGSGADTLHGSVTANDELTGGSEGDKLVGNGGNDTFFGGSGDDAMFGGYGDDRFHEGFFSGATDGADLIDGGNGLHDYVDFTNYLQQVTVSLTSSGDGLKQDGVAGEGDDVRSTVEDVDGSLTAPNTIIGNDAANRLLGGISDDILIGLRGGDRLFGASGNDLIFSNSLQFAPGPAIPEADGARDTLNGESDTDTCQSAPEDGDVEFSCEN